LCAARALDAGSTMPMRPILRTHPRVKPPAADGGHAMDKRQRAAFVRAHQQEPLPLASPAHNAQTRPAETPNVYRAAAARARAAQREVTDVNNKRTLFKQADGDSNGRLDLQEVRSLLNLETDAEARAMIEELDEDGDGMLDFDEVSDAIVLMGRAENGEDELESTATLTAVLASKLARAAAMCARKAQAEALREAHAIGVEGTELSSGGHRTAQKPPPDYQHEHGCQPKVAPKVPEWPGDRVASSDESLRTLSLRASALE